MRSEMMIPGTLKRDYLGKINLYVANQNDIDTLGADELAALETECKTVEEANNTVAAQVKSLQSGFERRSRHACSV
jgi:26S proteasome regulatory subunit (ATPase 3-interacting protein)